jgi:hypothetical protein
VKNCPVCFSHTIKHFKVIDGIDYLECLDCESLFADFDQLNEITTRKYDSNYWDEELKSSRERSFGSSLARCAEVFALSQIEINKFVDIGTGPGYFLDAVSQLMPKYKDTFYGVEKFPPEHKFRSEHPNYLISDFNDISIKFDAGICVEVIEHLRPKELDNLIKALAKNSNKNALYLFNSGSPNFVKNEDPTYLDPLKRGHIVSYGIEGLRIMFKKYGFNVFSIPGRDWAFLAEFTDQKHDYSIEKLLMRLWHMNIENKSKLNHNDFGPLMYSIALESSRCYLEAGKHISN